jgi:hypothetical protein
MSGEQANPSPWADDPRRHPDLLEVKEGRLVFSVVTNEFVTLPGRVEHDLIDAEPGHIRLLDGPLETFGFLLVHQDPSFDRQFDNHNVTVLIATCVATDPRIRGPVGLRTAERSHMRLVEGPTPFVICPIKCPFGSSYGSKGDWTAYGRRAQIESIKARWAFPPVEVERRGRTVASAV